MKNLLKYIQDGIAISKNSNGTYTVFTPITDHFKIESLTELTPEKFEEVLKAKKENNITWDSEKRQDNPHHYTNRLD